ncbi:MAG: cobalt-precorrin 5A hydrolase [Pseudorhodobacter sp.]|jgi:cobalt-precorrin 5A hydrolase
MIVAGFGLRQKATVQSLQSLLAASGQTVHALAVVADKADLPAITGLATAMALPLHRIGLADLATDRAQTLSPRQPARYGKTSVAEAAALAAAGKGARLIQPRLCAADGMATVAIAEGTGL